MKVIRKEDKDSNVYIKTYSIEDGNIVLHTANGSNPRIINVPENKVHALELMWKQQDLNRGSVDELKTKISRNIRWGIINVAVAGASFAGMFVFSDSITFMQHVALSVVATAGVGGAAFVNIPKIVSTKGKLEDVLKGNILKKNAEYLNENLDLENINQMEGVSYSMRRQLEETAKRNETVNEDEVEDYFTINTIDSIPLKDLLKIRDNLKRDDYFSFEYNEQAKKETGKQKVYKNNN